MRGFGQTGQQQAQDCAFPAGTIQGAPLRISYFLVLFFVYQLMLVEVAQSSATPKWFSFARLCGNEALLLGTILSHEMGHGTMARRRGGDIAQVLLWPFGGICFTTRASWPRTPREKLVDDLWITAAGPATHFPMTIAWLLVLVCVRSMFGLSALASVFHHLNVFGSTPGLLPSRCMHDERLAEIFADTCLSTWSGTLVYLWIAQAIQLNVSLFLFNVFFPMYPMDGSKLIVCSLQLWCRASAVCTASVLIFTTVPLALCFMFGAYLGFSSGNFMSGIMGYMGFMCLVEAHRIWQLKEQGMLHTHPLFESARSDTVTTRDDFGTVRTINTAARDDVPARRPAELEFKDRRPFTGGGTALGGGGAALGGGAARGGRSRSPSPPLADEAGAGQAAAGSGRSREPRAGSPVAESRGAFLDRLEAKTAHQQKSPQELATERLRTGHDVQALSDHNSATSP